MISKRVIDLFVSSFGLVLMIPFFVIIAILIKCDSRGPIFFRQQRVGFQLIPFRIHKFRTMYVEQPAGSKQITVGKDARITPIGHFLRRYKIDEWPQLIDVLIGNMSLVGPRPEVPYYVNFYPPDKKKKIFSVRPGITDLASIHFRNESEMLGNSENPEREYISKILPIKLEYCERYIDQQSVLLDIALIWQTIKAVVSD